MPLMYVYLILYITGMHKSVEEFSVQTLELGGLGAALKALHLPFGKVFRGVVNSHIEKHCDVRDDVRYGSEVYLDPRDKKLIQTLVNNGDEHAKVLRGVVVWCEINAPMFFWNEMDTYRVGAERLSSSSTMHTLGKRDVTIDDFAVKQEIKDMLTPTEKYKPHELRVDPPSVIERKIFIYNEREYEVWNDGRIYSLPYDAPCKCHGVDSVRHYEKREIKPSLKPDGYYSVRMGGKRGGNIQYHRVLALCFVPNPDPENKTQVNHIDGDRSNDSVSNLEWMTPLENTRDAIEKGRKESTPNFRYKTFKHGLKYTEEVVDEINRLRSEGLTLKEIGALYNVSESTIWKATKRFGATFQSDFEEALFYENTIMRLNELAADYRETNSVDSLIGMKEILPASFMQKRVWMFSYQTLRRIYFQRRNHRLPQWRKFCDWIEKLPFAGEFITLDGNNSDKDK